MKSIKELEAKHKKYGVISRLSEGYLEALKDVLKLIDELTIIKMVKAKELKQKIEG